MPVSFTTPFPGIKPKYISPSTGGVVRRAGSDERSGIKSSCFDCISLKELLSRLNICCYLTVLMWVYGFRLFIWSLCVTKAPFLTNSTVQFSTVQLCISIVIKLWMVPLKRTVPVLSVLFPTVVHNTDSLWKSGGINLSIYENEFKILWG